MAARTRTQRDDQPGDRSLHEEFFLCVRERYRGAGGCGARQHRRVRCARRPREEELTKHLGLDAHDLESALDPDEISRVEFAPDTISLIWKRPKNAKLRANADRIGFSAPQLESLADLMLDNQQCSRQAQIYSSVASGLMDARGTIINNVSLLLKNLTLITVIFLPLNLIASIGGMSEFTMMTSGVDWRMSYSLLVIGMVAAGWVSFRALVRFFDHRQARRR
jgi:Mg2+ and Co2+ transporter CorA